MRDRAQLRALTLAEGILLARCLVLIPVIASGIALFGYSRVHAALARRAAPAPRVPDPTTHRRAESVARVVALAAAHGPVRVSCLRRSLLTWWLLRREGIETVLNVGVHRDGRGGLDAHAWVVYLGQPLTDSPDVADRFPAFDRDFAATPERLS